jgi:hypothetical protein
MNEARSQKNFTYEMYVDGSLVDRVVGDFGDTTVTKFGPQGETETLTSCHLRLLLQEHQAHFVPLQVPHLLLMYLALLAG